MKFILAYYHIIVLSESGLYSLMKSSPRSLLAKTFCKYSDQCGIEWQCLNNKILSMEHMYMYICVCTTSVSLIPSTEVDIIPKPTE